MFLVEKTPTLDLINVQMRCCVHINYCALEHPLPPSNCGRNIANKSIQRSMALFASNMVNKRSH